MSELLLLRPGLRAFVERDEDDEPARFVIRDHRGAEITIAVATASALATRILDVAQPDLNAQELDLLAERLAIYLSKPPRHRRMRR